LRLQEQTRVQALDRRFEEAMEAVDDEVASKRAPLEQAVADMKRSSAVRLCHHPCCSSLYECRLHVFDAKRAPVEQVAVDMERSSAVRACMHTCERSLLSPCTSLHGVCKARCFPFSPRSVFETSQYCLVSVSVRASRLYNVSLSRPLCAQVLEAALETLEDKLKEPQHDFIQRFVPMIEARSRALLHIFQLADVCVCHNPTHRYVLMIGAAFVSQRQVLAFCIPNARLLVSRRSSRTFSTHKRCAESTTRLWTMTSSSPVSTTSAG
jgi:hypothetical protein